MAEFINVGQRNPGNLIGERELYALFMEDMITLHGFKLEIYHYSMQEWFRPISTVAELKEWLKKYGNQTFAFRIQGEGHDYKERSEEDRETQEGSA